MSSLTAQLLLGGAPTLHDFMFQSKVTGQGPCLTPERGAKPWSREPTVPSAPGAVGVSGPKRSPKLSSKVALQERFLPRRLGSEVRNSVPGRNSPDVAATQGQAAQHLQKAGPPSLLSEGRSREGSPAGARSRPSSQAWPRLLVGPRASQAPVPSALRGVRGQLQQHEDALQSLRRAGCGVGELAPRL